VEIARKLEDVHKALDPVATQRDIVQFLKNTENAQGFSDLVDDISEAMMEYQVRAPKPLTLIASNICLRPPCNKASTTMPVS